MSNYVWHKIVCNKSFFENYLLDNQPFGEPLDGADPYITFNKLFGLSSLADYIDLYGCYIDYGGDFDWKFVSDNRVEVYFTTRWQAPIRAILRALELDSSLVWYFIEENRIYLSKFYWKEKVKESIYWITEHYEDWSVKYEDIYPDEEFYEIDIWEYLKIYEVQWFDWESKDDFARYLDRAITEVKLPEKPKE